MKHEKQIKQILKETKTDDLNSLKCHMDYFYKLEVKKRNQNKAKKFKVGDKVSFRTPVNRSTNHLPLSMTGTISKLGKSNVIIITTYGPLKVPAMRVYQ